MILEKEDPKVTGDYEEIDMSQRLKKEKAIKWRERLLASAALSSRAQDASNRRRMSSVQQEKG